MFLSLPIVLGTFLQLGNVLTIELSMAWKSFQIFIFKDPKKAIKLAKK